MEDWLTVEQASRELGVTPRQVNRYGSGERPRIRTERSGRRVLYRREDVEKLASELGEHRRLSPTPPPKTEYMASGEMLEYLRERDTQLKETQERLLIAGHRIGDLEGQLKAITEERDSIRGLLAPPKKRPWWQFWSQDGPS